MADLLTGFAATAVVGTLALADVDGGMISIGPRGLKDKTLPVVTLGSVQEASLNSQTPVKSLSVTEWLNTGPEAQITAAWITSSSRRRL